MRTARNWVRLSLLVLALALVMGQDRCPPPDYDAPGESGHLPEGAPLRNRYQEKAPANPPQRLVCDQAVYQTVNVSQQNANCQGGFNYAPLFTQAKGLADGIAAVTQCPRGCRPVHSWIERLETTCQAGTAGVILEIGLLCPDKAAKPNGVQIAPNDPRLNGQPFKLPDPPPNARQSIGDVTGPAAVAPLTCNPVEWVEYRYRERTPAACNAGAFNFRPYVQTAVRRAPMVCRANTCAAGCAPCVPPVIGPIQWGCNGQNEVDVRVKVQCCR